MNADPAATRSPHLDLADLIAEVTGQEIDGGARHHLASCQHCRTETGRWNQVADGVRSLAAAAPHTAPPARPRPGRLRALADPRRRVVLAAACAAAALVLIGGVGYGAGYIHLTFGTAGTGARTTVLTAVSGCAALREASGTLEQVSGSSLVIRTAGGQPVAVTTTTSTLLGESGPLLGDITDGASVTVLGPSSDGTIAALSVTIGNPAHSHPQTAPGIGVVKGTVSEAGTAGFTVITSGGTRVPVTTSRDTIVTVLNASLGQLPAGATVYAVGYAGPDGTLAARAVAAIRQLPQGDFHLKLQVKNCSPASIDSVLAFGG